jgi:hypothetical protein
LRHVWGLVENYSQLFPMPVAYVPGCGMVKWWY